MEKYFICYEESRDLSFKNLKKYLSKVISDSQFEYAEANQVMNDFIIKHTLLMNINPFEQEKNAAQNSRWWANAI